MSRSRILPNVISALVLGLATTIASAQPESAPVSSRDVVTDPATLVRMGFPPDAKNVFKRRDVGRVMRETREEKTPSDFGTGFHYTSVGAKSFIGTANTSPDPWYYDGGFSCCGELSRLGGINFADAQIDLPDGALLTGFRWWMYDASPVTDMALYVIEVCTPDFAAGATTYNTIVSADPATSGSGGYQSAFIGITPLTVNNLGCHYLVRVRFDTIGETLSLQRVRAQWERQVSPDPGTATFSDVPVGHPQHRFVEALVAAGITAGCGGGQFCPNQAVTRGQMAVFLSVALGLNF